MYIGAQLYTVRDHAKTLEDLSVTLSRIADIGYRYVQVSGTCPYDAEWLDRELKKNGLKCTLTHIPKDRLINDTDAVLREHELFGCKYIGLGYHKFTDSQKEYDAFCDTYRPVAEKIAMGGGYFMYHNHASEFTVLDKKNVLTRLCEDFPADRLGFTLDTYWILVGGEDPAEYIEKFANRAPCIHLKDYGENARMEVLGEGCIDLDRVFEKARDAGVEYMFVEQDNCNGEDPFECLKRSYDFLRSRGF